MAHGESHALHVFKSRDGKTRYLQAYEAVLQGWPIPYEELDLPTAYGTTHAIASGPADAPALILLPSLAASATLWRPNVAALSEHYRTYAIDVIGQVGKSVPTRRILTRQDCAHWLTDVLDALGIRRASIIGSSYGGFLALNQASITPERVERVILISPAGTFVGLSWRFYFLMLVKAPVRRLLRPKRPRDITDLLGNEPTLTSADAPWAALMSVTMSESARPNTVTPIAFSESELEAIRAPTLLLIGENERLYDPRATLKRALKRMPGLSGAIVPNAHHLAALAQPDDVNARMLLFLQQNDRPPSPA